MMFGNDMTQAPVYHAAPVMHVAHVCHAPVVHDALVNHETACPDVVLSRTCACDVDDDYSNSSLMLSDGTGDKSCVDGKTVHNSNSSHCDQQKV